MNQSSDNFYHTPQTLWILFDKTSVEIHPNPSPTKLNPILVYSSTNIWTILLGLSYENLWMYEYANFWLFYPAVEQNRNAAESTNRLSG